jgi:Cu+-exporting ATPase
MIAALRELAIEPIIASGDREPAVRAVADAIGVGRFHSSMQPADKAALVTAERKAGRGVAMVGDGVNDAPALAAADVGIAIASGTDLAAAAGGITLLHGVRSLPIAFALARATMATIRRNLVAASIYNVVCVPIAAAGLLSPVLASAAMSLSSVSVVLSSLWMRKWHGPTSVANS